MSTKRVSRSAAGNFFITLFVLMFAAFMMLPIYYTIINSLKPINELFYFPPRFYVTNPTLENFVNLIKMQAQSEVPFERYLFNSVFTSVISTVGYVFLASMAAYPLAKHNFPCKKLIINLVVIAIMFRPEVTSIPQYMIMSGLGLIDTFASIILPAMSGSFGVFLLMQFMGSIPNEIIESCRLDGAGEIQTFWRIILPMVKPAWMTVVIFTFVGIWGATGSQFIYSEDKKMLITMLSNFTSSGIAMAGVSAAVGMVMLLLPVIVFLFSQRSVVETMAYSGLKG